jgi:excisionase family DNA binding protein
METQLIAISEAARRLGVSPFTVRRLVRGGDVVAVNVGARRLIPSSEIERIMRSGVGQPRSRRGIGSVTGSQKARR